MSAFSLNPHIVKREILCLFLFYKGFNLIMRALLSSLTLTLSPKDPISKYHHIVVISHCGPASTYGFQRSTNIQPITFIIKTLTQLRIEGEFPQLDKDHLQKPTADILLNGKILNAFPQEQGKDVYSHHSYSS